MKSKRLETQLIQSFNYSSIFHYDNFFEKLHSTFSSVQLVFFKIKLY